MSAPATCLDRLGLLSVVLFKLVCLGCNAMVFTELGPRPIEVLVEAKLNYSSNYDEIDHPAVYFY